MNERHVHFKLTKIQQRRCRRKKKDYKAIAALIMEQKQKRREEILKLVQAAKEVTEAECAQEDNSDIIR
jgi:hypothetical protein